MIKRCIGLIISLAGVIFATSCGDPSASGGKESGVQAATTEELGDHGHDAHGHGHPSKPGVPYSTRDPRVLQIREKKVRQIYENLVYPTPIAILKGEKSVDDIFEKDSVKGRVTPVGQFPDFSAVVEYFYALAISPGSRVDAVKFRSVIAGDDRVAVAVDIFFCRAPYTDCDPNNPVSANGQTLTQVGFYQFNRQNRVISMDLNILNLGAASDPPNTPAAHAEAIANVCTALTIAHVDLFTGSVVLGGTCTEYFDSEDDFATGFPLTAVPFQNCVAFMSSIPFGTWDRANSNTVTCRQLHTLLTAVDPDVHCPHTSADGGGACIDFTYGSYYDEQF